jgi:hypothetical protein
VRREDVRIVIVVEDLASSAVVVLDVASIARGATAAVASDRAAIRSDRAGYAWAFQIEHWDSTFNVSRVTRNF